jgi:hypothetical protein
MDTAVLPKDFLATLKGERRRMTQYAENILDPCRFCVVEFRQDTPGKNYRSIK